MKNPIRIYFEREEEKWQTVGIKRWEQQRKAGKFMFASKFGLLLSVITNAVLVFFDYFLFSGIKLDTILIRTSLLFIFSFIGFLIVWRINERKYHKYLGEKPPVL